MDQQMATAIAVTLATKAAEGLAGGGRAAFEALARVVRRAFQGRPSARIALVDAEADPANLLRQLRPSPDPTRLNRLIE
jgi:hypothetical protein